MTIHPDLRERQAVVAFGDATAVLDGENAPAVDSVVEFPGTDGKIVHECAVHAVEFRPDQLEADKLQFGNCALRRVAGLPQLLPGHAQMWEFPDDLSTLSVRPVETMNIATVSERLVYLMGFSAGPGQLAWLSKEEDGVFSINACLMHIVPQNEAAPVEDADLCRDVQGAPLRLTPGAIVELSLEDSEGKRLDDAESIIALESVAEVVNTYGKEEYSGGVVVKAVAPGSTSLTLIHETPEGELEVKICAIVVQ